MVLEHLVVRKMGQGGSEGGGGSAPTLKQSELDDILRWAHAIYNYTVQGGIL